MIFDLGERSVKTEGTVFIAPTASVIGSVILHDNTSVWFNVVIRGDNDLIEIGEGSNIQDGSVLHVDPGYPIAVGRNVTIGHKVMLHGCRIGDGSLIGMNAVVLNGATIGQGCLIGANALVTENMQIPDGSMVLGSPGKIRRTLDDTEQAELLKSAEHYVAKITLYRESLRQV